MFKSYICLKSDCGGFRYFYRFVRKSARPYAANMLFRNEYLNEENKLILNLCLNPF